MNIDLHAHCIPEELIRYIEADKKKFQVEVEADDNGSKVFHHAAGFRYPVFPEFYDAAAMRKASEAGRFDMRAYSIAPTLFFYDLDRKAGQEFCRTANEMIAELVRANSDVMRGMATVPLQHPDLAAEELEYAVIELGLSAVEIGTSVEGRGLDDPAFEPFFAACDKFGLLVFLHPYYIGVKPMMENYYLTNSIGNPLDTMFSAAALIHGGVVERFPNVKFLLAHGGGFLPYQLGRLDHAFRARSEPKVKIANPPSTYLDSFYFDTITFNEAALRFLVERVGAGRVVLGTDAPFDMGDEGMVAFVEGAIDVPDVRERVLSENAASVIDVT